MSFAGQLSVVREVERALQALVRAVRAQRLYRENNATLARVYMDTRNAFEALLASQPLVTLKIRPEGFFFADERVGAEPANEDSISLALYRDGIRRLELSAGLEPEELRTLILAIAHGARFSGIGDDIVSLLWRRNLEHVRYVVVDTTIVDAPAAGDSEASASQDIDQIDTQIEAMLAAIYGAPGADRDTITPSMTIDSTDIAARQLSDDLESLGPLARGLRPLRELAAAPAYAMSFQEALAGETESELALRVSEVIIDALTGSLSELETRSLHDSLLLIFDSALTGMDLHLATELLLTMARVASMALKTVQGRFDAWMNEAISEARLRGIIPFFKSAGPEELARLQAFLRACGPRALPVLLATLATVGDEQKRALADLILEIGVEDLDPIEELLRSENLANAQEAVYLITGIDTAAARALVEQATTDPRPEIRIAVLKARARVPVALLQMLAAQLLQDHDPRVVVAAANALAETHSAEAARAMESAVRGEQLEEAAFEIKLAFLQSYASLNQGRALLHLARQIKKAEGLLVKKAQEDMGVAAVQALAFVRTQKSIDMLKAVCASSNRRLGEVAREVLVRMKRTS